MSRQIICAALVALLTTVAHAQSIESQGTEVLYVTDQLRLSLYSQADSQSSVIQLLSSGDKLNVEEIAGPYAKVTSPTGKQGWVKRGFLVSDPTSNLLLKQVTKDNELLKEELDKLKNSKIVLDQYEADMDDMSAKITGLEQENAGAEQKITELEQTIQQNFIEEQKLREGKPALESILKIAQIYWQYIALALLIILLIGYLLGTKITEASVKRKFQGIKVW
jgi:SH3 domain protein